MARYLYGYLYIVPTESEEMYPPNAPHLLAGTYKPGPLFAVLVSGPEPVAVTVIKSHTDGLNMYGVEGWLTNGPEHSATLPESVQQLLLKRRGVFRVRAHETYFMRRETL